MLRRRSLADDHVLMEREQKSFVLLELIRQGGLLTRAELSQRTGFNIVTVSNYMADFLQRGLVVERGLDASTGGRKPVLVELNAKAGVVIGLDLGLMGGQESQTVSVITDLRGQILHRIVKRRETDTMEGILQNAKELIRESLEATQLDRKKFRGIGIGIPGIMDERAGTARNPSQGSTRANYHVIRDDLEAAFNLPVLIGNDATLAGYGELRLGMDKTVQNLVYFYSEMGASLVLNGHIYWGSGGSAGELGLCLPSPDDYLTWERTPGFVFPNTKDLGLSAKARKLIEEGHQTTIRDLVQGRLEAVTMAAVIQAAQAGDQLAQELIEHSALQLGIRIATIVNLLNPEVVVIGGGIEKAGSLLLEPVWRAVKRYAYEEPASQVDILPAKLGENAVALGAACWVIREVFIQS